ncbi:hypothetical protein BH23THE1_BH23THE1_27060 [soil metagenome]
MYCCDYTFDPLHTFIFSTVSFFMNESNISKVGEEKPSQIQKITPFLWFDNQAEQAANFYVTVFKNPKMGKVT